MLQDVLSRYGCTLSAMVTRYEGCAPMENLTFSTTRLQDGSEETTLIAPTGQWLSRWEIASVANRPDSWDIRLTFRLTRGEQKAAAVAMVLEVKDWSVDNYVLIPCAAYNGNRFRSMDIPYPPLFHDTQDHRVDLPITVTNIPRLNIDQGPSRIEQTTADAATPAMGFYHRSKKFGLWLLTEQKTRLGNSGLFVEESDDRRQARLMITAPCVRQKRQIMCGQVPSDDRAADWKAGDEVTLRLRLCAFDADRLQGLFDRFAAIRKDMTGPTQLNHQLPYSFAFTIQEKKYNDFNWCEDLGYYSVGNKTTVNECWQIGWIGGGIATYPLLLTGHEESRRRALRNLETVFTKTQSPSGFFYGSGDGHTWYSDSFFTPHPHHMHLIRKNADALYYFIKQFMLLEDRDAAWRTPAAWTGAVRRQADAFAKLWERYGQFGQFIHIETGDIMVGGSSCGAMAIGALALAWQYYKEPRYLKAATAAAKFYYQRDVQAGLTTGGPGEILQAPDSESAFAFLESFITLYEITGETEWLTAAEEIARQCATWCVSYDYAFPPTSLFGRLGIHSTGAVWASVQNKHGAPGICTLSGNSLLRLYRATNNPLYLDLLQDTAHNITQYLSRPDRRVGKMDSGWMCERVNLSDWEGADKVGEVFGGTTWAEVACMLTNIEVPGLYVRPDQKKAWTFDHIEARVMNSQPDAMTLQMTNPTNFPAQVRILTETADQARQPLAWSGLWRCPTVTLNPGESRQIYCYNNTIDVREK